MSNHPDQPCQEMAALWCATMARAQAPSVSVECLRAGWGNLQKGTSTNGTPLRIHGETFEHGLGTHADSEIRIHADGGLVRFSATAGFDQNELTLQEAVVKARLIFSAEAEGQELWRSEEMSVQSAGARLDLPLPKGTKTIVLKAWSTNGHMHGAHADWAAAFVELASGEKIELGDSPFPQVPFSFVYNGKDSSELLPDWQKTFVSREGTADGVNEHIVTWKDPATGLECRLELKEFTHFPALEWVVYFRHTGEKDTPILKDIQALDVVWKRAPAAFPDDGSVSVYRSRGSMVKSYDFEYQEDKLLLHEKIQMGAHGGRPSYHWLPFFNTDLGDYGIFTAIGWTGQWSCTVEHPVTEELHIRAGMEKTHLKLHPGEEIRSPRIAQLFWKGDRIEGHNTFRRFLLNHHTPRPKDAPVTGPFTIAHWGGMPTQSHLDRIALYQREKISQEYLWVDAGWYGLNSSFSADEFAGDWGQHTGDWRPNAKAHPAGLKPIADAAKDAGMKFMLWVEPERAYEGTLWPQEHPEYFLRNSSKNLLLNLGNPEALQGCLDLVSKLIRENDVSVYREDFNIDPLDYWEKNDPPDRQGMTEIRFTAGLYAFWDALLELHPGLIIDNCASGGRRIDLETISRSVALWRSDLQCFQGYPPEGAQVNGMGLSYWLPMHGTGTWSSMMTKADCSTYRVRSTMGPAFMMSAFMRESAPIQDDYPWEWFRKMGADYLRARPFYTGDYYPLLEPVTPRADQWAVYQMDRPDLGEGFVMAFRRANAPWEKGSFQLRALQSDASYEVEDADTGKVTVMNGAALRQGLEIVLREPESSALLFYKKR